MPHPRSSAMAIFVVGMLVAACGAAAPRPSPIAADPASGAPTSASGSATPTEAWATAPLTDVATGETFRIADHAGSVVIVETMAIWCSNCRAQQGDVQAALAKIPDDRVVYVVLDIDPNEDGPSLAEYQRANGSKVGMRSREATSPGPSPPDSATRS